MYLNNTYLMIYTDLGLYFNYRFDFYGLYVLLLVSCTSIGNSGTPENVLWR